MTKQKIVNSDKMFNINLKNNTFLISTFIKTILYEQIFNLKFFVCTFNIRSVIIYMSGSTEQTKRQRFILYFILMNNSPFRIKETSYIKC